MDRVWVARLRWRLRGAWQWPTYVVLTAVDAALLLHLPPGREGPRTLVAAILVAGVLNLVLLAAVAPVLGRTLRRRRPDLPTPIAANYAGVGLLLVVAAGLLVGGVLHRPVAAADRREAIEVAAAFRRYARTLPGVPLASSLGPVDVLRLKEDVYRACVPRDRRGRWACGFVATNVRPLGITADDDRISNASYRVPGGFR